MIDTECHIMDPPEIFTEYLDGANAAELLNIS